ncbi:hypothetical protein Clacol_002165 [Clathrus columnatus]|uniref:Uncharacterized protein n=1 Tax=Clathrus columnatus TaxID=1419009 RepID=A0AAV5A423_9AGAM|nr:hypothetical protein Clacol_002165 [Clathrus columnatus]
MSTIITIPNCSITHVLGRSAAIPLTTGDLTLIKYSPTTSDTPSAPVAVDLQASPDTSPLPNLSSKPIFTLQIGDMAFPLSRNTTFGTDANSTRRYMFVPDLGPAGQASQGGHVCLDLPESSIEPGVDGKTSQQDVFEQALIEEGLLKEGWEAIREDITKGVRETVGEIRDKVTNTLTTDTGRTPPEAIEPHDEKQLA